MDHLSSAAVVKGAPIQIVVDCPEWQVVRKKMINNWVRNHGYNIDVLRAYLDEYAWSPLAVRRVLNVLVGSVHRCGHTAGQPETDKLRLEVRTRWARLQGLPIVGIQGSISEWKGTFA